MRPPLLRISSATSPKIPPEDPILRALMSLAYAAYDVGDVVCFCGFKAGQVLTHAPHSIHVSLSIEGYKKPSSSSLNIIDDFMHTSPHSIHPVH